MTKDGISHITCEHLQKLRKGDEEEHVVLDVRDRLEFEAGHIKGSFHVPKKELENNVKNIIPTGGARVIVVAGATQEEDIEEIHATLEKVGYANVEFLAGGFDKWCEIAPLDVDDLSGEDTPEERGFTGDELSDIDPESHDNEPLY